MAQVPISALKSGPSHLDGLTRLAFSRDGQTIFTGGSDCILRYHASSHTDDEPGFFDEHTDSITCLSTSSSCLITGCSDSQVRRYAIDGGRMELDGLISRSSGVGIRWLAVEPTGDRVAICSDELIVKVVSISDPTSITIIPNLLKPPRSASWHPTNGLLSIITSDGKIQIYEFISELRGGSSSQVSASCLKTVDNLVAPYSQSGSGSNGIDVGCAIAWHPSGEYFVVPSRTQEISIIDRDTWTKKSSFSISGHDAELGLLTWSPNGKYLASSDKDGVIIIWETNERKPIVKTKARDGAMITGLEWSPTENLLAYTTEKGDFYTWPNVIPPDRPDPAKRSNNAAGNKNGGDMDIDMFEGLDDDDEDDGDKGIDLDREEDDDDWIIDDDGNKEAIRRGKDGEGSVGGDWEGTREVVSITKAQPAFQPGSTQMRAKKRYLAFNMIGVVDVTDLDTHHIINVEFHDKSARRGYHFQDHNRFSMAAMGEQGIAFAARTDEGRTSTISYRAYDAWASQSDWQVSFPVGEEVVAIAVGGKGVSATEDEMGDSGMGSVIAATSKGYIRFFSGSGLQRYVWRLGEEVVAIVAGKEEVLIVHREGGTSLDGCQNLRFSAINMETFDVIQEGRLPLPKKTTLSWIGFSAANVPVMYDSTGLLSCLDRSKRSGQGRWVPLLDTNLLARKENKSEFYWPVGVSDTQMMCVILKGAASEPYFPRPIVMEVDIQLPLLNMDVAQGQMEEKLLRQDLQLTVLKDAASATDIKSHDITSLEVAQDKELLQLVQAACKADKLQRALDLTRLMHNLKSMDAAAKVAGFYHLPGLQDKILMVKDAVEEKRFAEEAEARSSSRRSAASRSVYGMAPRPATNGSLISRDVLEFAPRDKNVRRTAKPAAASIATTYEASSYDTRESSFIPETPQEQDESVPGRSTSPSPNGKRKRTEVTEESESAKRVPAKNPFARKKEPASNPFAKPLAGKSALATKSTSFFERVDDIEQNGKVGVKKGKGKAAEKGKQTTLFGLPPGQAREAPKPKKSKDSTSVPQEEASLSKDAETEDHEMGEPVPEEALVEQQSPGKIPEEELQVAEDVEGAEEAAEEEGSEGEPIEWDASDDETQT